MRTNGRKQGGGEHMLSLAGVLLAGHHALPHLMSRSCAYRGRRGMEFPVAAFIEHQYGPVLDVVKHNMLAGGHLQNAGAAHCLCFLTYPLWHSLPVACSLSCGFAATYFSSMVQLLCAVRVS